MLVNQWKRMFACLLTPTKPFRHWLALVVHEYAHAQAGSPGHHQDFAVALIHLCRGLSLKLPEIEIGQENSLRLYPACQIVLDSWTWWQGKDC